MTMLTATSIWNSLWNYERCSCNCKLQFPGKNSFFRKDFQMLFTVNEGEIQTPNRVLGQKYNNKVNNNPRLRKN